MPLFTPDARSRLVGRPSAMWFTRGHDYAWYLALSANGEWVVLEVPTPAELSQYPHYFNSGRETYVTYEQVRDWNLTSRGRVRYVDDYDDEYTDVYISKNNTPYVRATSPEPVWSAA